jgi:predicted acetyltransferase
MAQPTYLPLPEHEFDDYLRNEAQAFHVDLDLVRVFVTPEDRGQLRGLYENGRKVAQLQILPLRIKTSTGAADCGGIAGVVTLPEARRRGYTAQLLRHACDELLSRNIALCMLFPFKVSFYRQFGWATCMERKIYSGAPEQFVGFRSVPGGFARVGIEAVAELDRIYDSALRGRFGTIVRDERWWRMRVLSDGKKERNAYIWRDAAGAGRAYVVYSFAGLPGGGQRMQCREAVALDPEARSQLFAFMANHDSQCQEAQFRAPTDAPVNLLMPNPLKCEIEPYFMLRLLDVAAALSMSYPSGINGQLTISVRDDWLDQNNGTFALEVANGQGRCERLPDGRNADLVCDVRVLTQMYTRYLRPRTAAAFGLLEVRDRAALALADQLFSGLAPFSSDFF